MLIVLYNMHLSFHNLSWNIWNKVIPTSCKSFKTFKNMYVKNVVLACVKLYEMVLVGRFSLQWLSQFS